MTELRLFLESLQAKHSIEDPDFNHQIMRFLADNQWFGNNPIRKDGKVCLEDFSPSAAQRIDDFCGRFGKTLAEKNRSLFDQLAEAVPETTISTWHAACSIHRSFTAGTPRFRIEPSSFGICTLRTGNGLYRLSLIISFISSLWSEMNSGSRLTGIRSIPADPLLLITFCRASS